MENAIDAGSSSIKVVVKDAGKTLIQVIDDGVGMSATDARMCFEKHATSKIKTTDDLFNIHTMGFRGEALASIAAVAQVEMETCLQQEDLGTCIVIEGTAVKSQTPVATPRGTKVSVKNLFFNVPARRNFLKSNAAETKHILDEFQRTALAQPGIAFALYQNGQETYQLPAAKLSHRIVHLLGEPYRQQLIPCQEQTDTLKIQGYVGKPAQAKKTRGEQFFFVNQRYIKSPYLHHAVKNAFEGLLPQDAFPFYVLCLDVAPARIDVNVHPTKTEIKFDDERTVYAVLTATIKRALATHHVMPSIDFEQSVNFNPFKLSPTVAAGAPPPASTTAPPPAKAAPPAAQPSAERQYAQFKRPDASAQGSAKDWERLTQRLTLSTPSPSHNTPPQPAPSPKAETPKKSVTESGTKLQLHGRYLLAPIKSGLVLIDQHAAHERILYERYVQPMRNSRARSAQQLLFPAHVSLNPADLALVQAHERDLQVLGFMIESFGKDSIIVAGCPAEAADHDLKQLLEGLIEQFKWNQTQFSLTAQENLARALAKRACIQPGKLLHKEEVDTLVDQLFACENPNYAPDGRRTFVMLTLEDIQKLF